MPTLRTANLPSLRVLVIFECGFLPTLAVLTSGAPFHQLLEQVDALILDGVLSARSPEVLDNLRPFLSKTLVTIRDAGPEQH